MKRATLCIARAAVMAIAAGTTLSRAAPVVVGDITNPQCRAAKDLADAAFGSPNYRLTWPVAHPRGSSRIILARNAEDMSLGDALSVDPFAFDAKKVADPSGYGTMIYRRTAKAGSMRLAIVDRPFNWQGHWYTAHLLPEETTTDDLVRDIDAHRQGQPWRFEPLFGDNNWLPPIVLNDTRSGVDRLIDVGAPFELMADWRVLVVHDGRAVQPCRITFGLSSKGGLAMLPAEVRNYAAAIDAAIGPGNDEGTLQPTARIRRAMAAGWANVALRPWAEPVAAPYNDRATVNSALRIWAGGSAKRRAVYGRIKAHQRSAENELAQYYVRSFAWPASMARAASHKLLDHMLRANFIFAKTT